jgi:hypothetical protein
MRAKLSGDRKGNGRMTATTARPASSTQLAQIVAIVGGVKTRTEQALTRAYHQIQKPQPFSGIARTYRPRDDEGEQLSPESTQVQVRVDDLVADVSAAIGRMLDVVATQDWANTTARADLIVDGQVLLENVPVTYLMWLEKQVIQLRTFIAKLPVLDVAEDWTYDEDAQAYATAPTESTRTKKVPRNHVISAATERHPAQVTVWHEDIVAGYWKTIRFSGALPGARVFELSGRVDRLLDAVRFARERANLTPVTDIAAGDPILTYIFGVRP